MCTTCLSRAQPGRGLGSATPKKRGVTRFQFPLFGTTRWFSRAECIVVLAQNIHALIPFLEEVVAVAKANKKKPWGKAVAILPSLKSYLNVSMVFLMRDILIPTEVLNKILQSDSLLPHELNSKVADTKAVLTAMCLGAGIDYNLAKKSECLYR